MPDTPGREEARRAHNEASRFKLNKKIYIFDQDGTLYLDHEALPGSQEVIAMLKKNGKKIIFLSNNSSASQQTYSIRLTEILGMPIEMDEIYTSTQATIDFLKAQQTTRIYPIGTPDFEEEMRSAGFEFSEIDPEIIVLAFDKTLTYKKLATAALLMQKGVEYVATHPDDVCPTKEGYIPDTGSFIALFEKAVGISPRKIMGKPNPVIVKSLLAGHNLEAEDAIIFGDRLYTDIELGKKSGIATALMLTGESTVADIEKFGIVPDFVFKNMNEVLAFL